MTSPTDHTSPLAGLRIAYVAFDPFPNRKGSGTRLHYMSSALREAGADVHMITLPPSCPDAPPKGVVLHSVRIRDDNYLRRAVVFRQAIARKLIAIRPDVVHFRGPFEGQAAVSYARRFGALTVYEVNGLPSVELAYHYPAVAAAPAFEGKLRAMEQELFQQADVTITQSWATERFLRFRGMPPGKTSVIPNGADPTIFTPPNDPSSSPSSALTALYEGTLAPWQGLGDVLTALRRVDRQVPMKLRVVGTGRKSWKKELLHLARRLKVSHLITWNDAVDKQTLASMVQAADVCLVPLSRDRRNRVQGCSPIKVFEYMASARAVVASDLPATRELIDDGWDGLLSRASRPHHLAQVWTTAAVDGELRRRLGRRARQRILRSGTWSLRQAQLVGVYVTRVVGHLPGGR